MNLPSWLIATLLSMSNLAHLLDRITTDGKYDSVLLIDANPLFKYTDFSPQLANLSFGKYKMYTTNEDYYWQFAPNEEIKRKQFLKYSGTLPVIMVNYDAIGQRSITGKRPNVGRMQGKYRCEKLKSLLLVVFRYHREQNIVLLNPMLSDDRKKEFWQCFGLDNNSKSDIRYMNCSVIFYQTETSMPTTSSMRKSIELFVLKPGKHVEIDVENSVCDGCNLNDKIFGSIGWPSDLFVETPVSIRESVTKVPAQQRNDTVINFGNSDYYLANFIARNSRSKDIQIHQMLEYRTIKYYNVSLFGRSRILGNDNELFHSNVSKEKYYAELYNMPPGIRTSIERSVFYNFKTKTIKK